ncbi:hypothetical protein [Kitasatospora sp. NPDC047058]|uniref:hypothetical protein n=1 Tax=Kitasatospora sp. NPDC047058 TaxID=3155620 RepID=UPI0033E2CD49
MDNGMPVDVAEMLRARDALAYDRAYRVQRGWTYLAGFLAVAGWIWAIGLAFLPASVERAGRTIDCGSPVLVDEPSEHSSRCASVVDGRIRSAVGVSVVTIPLSAAWIWAASGLRFRRLEASADEAGK